MILSLLEVNIKVALGVVVLNEYQALLIFHWSKPSNARTHFNPVRWKRDLAEKSEVVLKSRGLIIS